MAWNGDLVLINTIGTVPSSESRVVADVFEDEGGGEADALCDRPLILIRQLFRIHELECMAFNGVEGCIRCVS